MMVDGTIAIMCVEADKSERAALCPKKKVHYYFMAVNLSTLNL